MKNQYPFYSSPVFELAGEIKFFEADFQVTEIPLYEPSGEGDHVYFLIEKRRMTTNSAIVKIAQALNMHPRDVGVAGLKDSRAVTRQMLSIEHVSPSRVESLDIPGIRILKVDRHRNKLKMGHLAGNRFSIRLRNAASVDIEQVQKLLDWLQKNGVPNYFGEQRFGIKGDTWEVGRALVKSDYKEALSIILGRPAPELEGDALVRARQLFDAGDPMAAADAWPSGFGDNARLCRIFATSEGHYKKTILSAGKKMLTFYVSAYQSWLFNQVLSRRLKSGTMQTMLIGDIAWKHDKGVCFQVTDSSVDSLRAQEGQISPTGPLFGKKMKWPSGVSGDFEKELLDKEGITADLFSKPGPFKSPGGRRPLRIFPSQCTVERSADEHGDYYQFDFCLPAGAYATVLLRELTRTTFDFE
ncbi:MAG: tRNA pseudouridine(13) synthase TruD [Deltaproteobacteria bacterium]|nr:tRNA pseudouridine(13) synthase TruD [Deltaproteobacteria bacterium]